MKRIATSFKLRACNGPVRPGLTGPEQSSYCLAQVLDPQQIHKQSQTTTTTMTSGTQSPPLEATGEHKPMGISSVNNPDAKIEVVPDSEQRARTCSSSVAANQWDRILT